MNIEPYRGDALALYDEIVDAKTGVANRRDTLKRLRDKVDKLYRAYRNAGPNLERLSPHGYFSRDESRALMHCYDTETAPLLRMKRDVLAALPKAANKCPYCGLGEIGHGDDDVGGWDHYLPRRARRGVGFAEFAVLPLNLVPCCAICNGRKGERWKNGTQRIFLNVYQDTIDQREPLLEARIDTSTRDPRVTYQFVHGPHTPFFSHFMRHCNALDLRRRYAWVARSELVSIVQFVRRSVGREATYRIEDELQGRADDEAKVLGINHWKPTLYRAAAKSHEFVRFCREFAIDAPDLAKPAGAAGGQSV
jgi:hypothetical protein